ncbi:hypothetical protein ASPCAL10267 [Aspergillus calidoustus]|uniref:Arrestin-like N-terminal domain-containing protein n=1 Tax=Aspergillus calidoustus TaxID=454130 RepID=A0A0U5G5T3_ASPCI|nr:hypothetical protein ASPCAL10267 [Aspergillus calidoustus]
MLQFKDLRVMIEGIQSTREFTSLFNSVNIKPYPGVYRDLFPVETRQTFLSVEYNTCPETIQDNDNPKGSRSYSFPFFFILPATTTRPDDGIPRLCQSLPPTFEANIQSSASDLSVQYVIRAIIDCVRVSSRGTSAAGVIEGAREIGFLPYTMIQPPIQTAWFPNEFITRALLPLRRHVFGRRLGCFTLSASEPCPLIYSLPSDLPSTECALKIIASIKVSAISHLQDISLKIKSAISVRTFYSPTPSSCVPGQLSQSRRTGVRFDTKEVGRATQHCAKIDWTPSSESPTANEFGSEGDRDRATSDAKDKTEVGHWETMILVPSKPQEALLPTFCSTLLARSYTLRVYVQLLGVKTERALLEVPLQVVYPVPSKADSASGPERPGPCKGPIILLAQDNVRDF